MAALARPPARAEVDAVLDLLHASASQGEEEAYFALYTPDAVFVGTDATEVWTLPEFRAFAAPHFARGSAWTYTPVERTVAFDEAGRTAWFHESLQHDRYGQVRGSGVLVRVGRRWLVAQYVLSFPVPNEAALDVIARIRSD